MPLTSTSWLQTKPKLGKHTTQFVGAEMCRYIRSLPTCWPAVISTCTKKMENLDNSSHLSGFG